MLINKLGHEDDKYHFDMMEEYKNKDSGPTANMGINLQVQSIPFTNSVLPSIQCEPDEVQTEMIQQGTQIFKVDVESPKPPDMTNPSLGKKIAMIIYEKLKSTHSFDNKSCLYMRCIKETQKEKGSRTLLRIRYRIR